MAAPPISLQFSERRPRTAFIETPHTGKAPLKKNWSFYKRTGSVWEDWDHVPPARLALFSRPDLGLKAAQAINTHYEREKALADARLWEQAVSQAQQRQVFARRREANERLEDYAGQERTRSARPNSARAACTARETIAASLAAPHARRARPESAGGPRARSCAEARLQGPDFATERESFVGLVLPRYAYEPRLPFTQARRFVPKSAAERSAAAAERERRAALQSQRPRTASGVRGW